jgi:hypothetical protein
VSRPFLKLKEKKELVETLFRQNVHTRKIIPLILPLGKEEVNPDVAGNGFVTARAKLV